MKKVTLKNRLNLYRFTLLDVIFLVIIFSLLSITITIFIFRKTLKINSTSDIDKVYNQIVNNYYQDVDKEELSNSAIDGMMKYLGEKYSIYMDTTNADALMQTLDGKYRGVGIVVQMKNNGLYIIEVLKGSPADLGGLQKDDIILQMDDYKISSSKNIQEAINYIKEHDEIAFLVKRNDSEVIINIKTSDVDNPVTSSRLLTVNDNNYGYIYVEAFSTSSYNQFKYELIELEKNDIKGLIIDLRDNRGGFLDQAVDISSMFVQKGKVLYNLKEKDKTKAYLDETDEKRDYPIVFIVNEKTASASELLALSLKENNGALIIGTNTYGKGKVQQTQSVGSDSMIKYTVATWLSPNHNNIDGIGVRPNYIVELSKKYYKEPSSKNDDQFNKALEVLINSK